MRKLRLGGTKLPSVNQLNTWWSRDSNPGLGLWSLHFSLRVVEMYLMYVPESEIPWVWFSYPLAASCALEQITILLCSTEKANDRTCLIGLLWDWNGLMQAKCLTLPPPLPLTHISRVKPYSVSKDSQAFKTDVFSSKKEMIWFSSPKYPCCCCC